jgi:subtilisin
VAAFFLLSTGLAMKPSLHSIVISLLTSLGITATLCAAPPEGAQNLKVLIRFNAAAGKAERDLVRGAGGTVHASFEIVPAVSATIPEAALQHLLQNPAIDVIEPDVEIQAHGEYDQVWGVTKIGCVAAHAGTYTGATAPVTGNGVKVAVCDTGINYNHPDLKANYAGGYDFVNGDADPLDDNGHGTHVSGTIAANNDGVGIVGVAPDVNLYVLKVLNSSGSGSFSYCISALDWCIANGIKVANFSLGASTDPGSTVKAAFDNAAAKGVICVCSAGNSGSGADTVGYPAKYPSCIAVASTTSSDAWSSFSSTGPGVDIAAPGSSIYSTLYTGGYGTMSGTSMACPHATGAVALLLSAGVSDTNGNGVVGDEVRNLLQSTAVDLGTAGFDNSFGYGRIDVAKALASLAGSPAPPAPVFNPPTNLAASVASRVVTLTWQDNSNVETGFEIQIGKPNKKGNLSWSVWTTTAANATSYTGPALTSGSYSFRVRAVNSGTYTAYSNTVSVSF